MSMRKLIRQTQELKQRTEQYIEDNQLSLDKKYARSISVIAMDIAADHKHRQGEGKGMFQAWLEFANGKDEYDQVFNWACLEAYDIV